MWISLSLTQHKRFPRFLVPSPWCPWRTVKAMVKPYLWWHLALWHLVANYSPGDLWQGQRHQTFRSCFNQYSQQLPWIHSAILQMTGWVYSSVFSTAGGQAPWLYVVPLRTLMSSGKNRVDIPLGGILKWFKIMHSFKNQRKAWPYSFSSPWANYLCNATFITKTRKLQRKTKTWLFQSNNTSGTSYKMCVSNAQNIM